MQIQRIQHLLEHPNEVVAGDRVGLEEWSNKYPYAGVFAMLLARCSSVSGHMNEENDILRAASSMSFRQPLFDLITRSKLIEEASMIHEALSGVDERGDEQSIETAESREEIAPAASPKSGLDPNLPVEREVLISAIERTIENDVVQWEGGDAQEYKTTYPIESADMQLIQDSISSPFSNWLMSRATDVGFGDAQLPVTPENQKAASDASSTESTAQQKRQMMDRFIAKNPKIGPIREDQEPKKWASESILEDSSLVTETMARIYAKQGLFDKARKAYHQLALNYPAKSTYFALQLKKLGDPDTHPKSSNE
jgi:hypothetical protein